MAITLSSAYLEEMRKASPEPIVQVAIQTSVPSSKSIYFHNGHNGVDSTIEGDPILQSVTAVAQEYDPLERDLQVGTLQVEVIDNDYTRDLMTSYSFYDADCLVYLLGPEVGTTDAVLIFRGRVESVRAEEGAIIFDITEYQNKLTNHKSSRTYISKHPLEVLNQAFQDVGIASAKIDSTTFSAGNFADISHYCFSSYGINGFMTADEADALPNRPSESDISWSGGWYATVPQSGVSRVLPDKLLKEYLQLTQSTMLVDSTGKLKMLKLDTSAAVAHHFTVDEYHSFEQDPKPALYNVVTVMLGLGSRKSPLTLKDATSITNYGERVAEVNSVYLSPSVSSHFGSRIDYPSSGKVTITGAGVSGFAGTRNISSTQVAADKIDAGNPFYGLYRSEVLKTTGNTAEGYRAQYRQYNTEGAAISAEDHAVNIELSTLASRPFAGSEAGDDEFPYLFTDVTAAYNFATAALTRYSNSAPKITLMVGLEFVNIELGDLISIDNDFFVSPELRLKALDSTVKFEVVGREILPVGDDVGIKLTAVYATKSSAPGTSISVITPPVIKESLGRDSINTAEAIKANMDHSVLNGLDVSTTSGLGFSIAAGALSTGASVRQTSEAFAMTATASKHTYIGVDAMSGQVIFQEVATSAAEPALSQNEIRLAKVVSDGSGVTSIVDMRRIGAITASQFNRELLTPATGVLWNGGFEDWADPGAVPMGWTETGDGVTVADWARETSVVHSGSKSLKMLNTSTNVVWYSGFIPIDSSTPYRVSLWARQTGNVTMRSTLYWYTSAKVAASTSSASITNAACAANDTWENRTAIVTPGSDVAYAKLKITRPTSPGYDCYWDDVTIKPEAPSFRARAPLAGGGTSITKDADTDLVFGTDIHDYGAVHDTSNGRFTAPSAGIYEVNLTVQVTCTGGEASMIAGYLYKNGSKFAVALGGLHSAGAYSASVTVTSGPMELDEGDYITPGVHVGNRNATLAADPDDSYFSGRKIS